MSQADDIKEIKGLCHKIKTTTDETRKVHDAVDEDTVKRVYFPRSIVKTVEEISETQEKISGTQEKMCTALEAVATSLENGGNNAAPAEARGLSKNHKVILAGGTATGGGLTLLAAVLFVLNLPDGVKQFLIQLLGG